MIRSCFQKLALWRTALLTAGAAAAIAESDAAMYVLPAIDAGFINELGRTSKNDGVLDGAPDAVFNYSVGAIDDAPLGGTDVPRKNYFTFDLSGIPGTEVVVSATLDVFNPPPLASDTPAFTGGYSSPDPTETFVLAGFPTDLSGMATFADELEVVYDKDIAVDVAKAIDLYSKLTMSLDTTPDFGMITVSDVDDGPPPLMIPLTPEGVGYVDAFKGGPVVLGGLLGSLDAVDVGDEVLFGFTKPLISGVLSPEPVILGPSPTPMLILETMTIPEPGSVLTLGLGLSLLAWRRRR